MKYKLIMSAIGCLLLLAGIFNWKFILAIFAWRDPPKTNKGIWGYRVVLIIMGLLALAAVIEM